MKKLGVYEWQYAVIHEDTSAFDFGEVIFLKSNPEWPLLVYYVDSNFVYACWRNKSGEFLVDGFPPESVLQYRYAGLVIWKCRYVLCLN